MKENQKIFEKYIKKKTALVANYRYSVLSRVKLCNTQFSPNLNLICDFSTDIYLGDLKISHNIIWSM